MNYKHISWLSITRQAGKSGFTDDAVRGRACENNIFIIMVIFHMCGTDKNIDTIFDYVKSDKLGKVVQEAFSVFAVLFIVFLLSDKYITKGLIEVEYDEELYKMYLFIVMVAFQFLYNFYKSLKIISPIKSSRQSTREIFDYITEKSKVRNLFTGTYVIRSPRANKLIFGLVIVLLSLIPGYYQTYDKIYYVIYGDEKFILDFFLFCASCFIVLLPIYLVLLAKLFLAILPIKKQGGL